MDRKQYVIDKVVQANEKEDKLDEAINTCKVFGYEKALTELKREIGRRLHRDIDTINIVNSHSLNAGDIVSVYGNFGKSDYIGFEFMELVGDDVKVKHRQTGCTKTVFIPEIIAIDLISSKFDDAVNRHLKDMEAWSNGKTRSYARMCMEKDLRSKNADEINDITELYYEPR